MNRSSRHLPHLGGYLGALSVATAALMAIALSLVFFYAPLDAEQGFLQKIFYLHVPLAIVSLSGFVLAALLAIMHLRTGEARWDMRSYVAIHMSLIFAVATLITGSIWARGSWGHWWVWSEPTLVSFLIVFLLYATYQPLRFAIEDPERQSRYASVFAISETTNVNAICGGRLDVLPSTRGCRYALASRTARKFIGTNAPAVIANTEA